MPEAYISFDVEWAQEQLNFYPDKSSFWDSPDGQEVIAIANAHKLEPATNNEQRKEAYRIVLHETEHYC